MFNKYQNHTWRKNSGTYSFTDTLEFNFFPVNLSSDNVTVHKTEFIDKDNYSKFKNDLPPSCFCWRNSLDAKYIYVWSTDSSEPPKIEDLQTEDLFFDSNPVLTCRLISEGLKKELEVRGFTTLENYKKSVFVNFNKGNFLSKIDIGIDSRVGIYPKFVIQSFFTSFQEDKIIYGLIIDLGIYICLDVSVNELVRQGMDCRGCYIKLNRNLNSDSKYNIFKGKIIGEVSDIVDGKISIKDCRDEILQNLNAELCIIEPTLWNLYKYIETLYPNNAYMLKTELHNELSKFNSPKEKHRLINIFVNLFLSNGSYQPIKVCNGASFTFAQKYQPRIDSHCFKFRRLNQPVYNHDYSSSKTSTWADKGLKDNGPYDKESFASNKDAKILFASPDSHKGDVERFIKKFENGFQDVFSGFKKKYHLKNAEFIDKYFTASNGSLAQDYEGFLIETLKDIETIDLCFVVIREGFKKLFSNNNPYFVSKSFLLSQGIPVQEITIEKMRVDDRSLKYICNNIGLASYAKIGGIPFVLRADDLVRKELVIGVGSSIVKESRVSRAEQIIGFTTIFKNNGDFRFNSCTPCVNFYNYEEALKNNIVESIENVAEQEGYSEGDEIRIIFHVYKKTGKKEKEAIKKALEKLDKYKIEFALLHVNDSHNFKIFDCTNNQSQNSLLHYVAPRGVSIELGPRERLINFIGPKQYRKRGCPIPLRITLDNCSTFKDLEYLTQQLYHFSFISWRGFLPSIKPVTVLYSGLIAGLNAKLCKIKNWNQNMIRTKLYNKMWFL